MILERESCTSVQMEIAGCYAKMNRAEPSSSIKANIPSGGQTSRLDLADFLTRGYGPEQQALYQMIGSLIESTPGELLTGEGNPGLALTGGSGHA